MKFPKKYFLLILTSTFIVLFACVLMQKVRSFAPQKPKAATIEIIVEKDIAYGKIDQQKLDLCRPKIITHRLPAIVLIHGGGGDKSGFGKICQDLAKNGFVAAAVNFRESPTPSYKVILLDNKLALSWLVTRDDVDPNKLAAWGGSLGGYISAMEGTFEDVNKVKCVCENAGPTDFTDPNLEGSPLHDDFVKNFFGGITYEQNPTLYENLSPITHISSNDAQTWLFTRSTNDNLVPRTQMTRMITALQAIGISTDFYEYNGTGPGHANNLPPREAQKLYNYRLNFMINCLNTL